MIRPQRIVHDSKPGDLLKRATAPTATARTSDHGDADYLALIRQMPCLSCGMELSEAAHLRLSSAAYGKASGLGKKPHDKWALSLCSQCHRLAKTAQHNRNEAEFWASLGINPLSCAVELYAARGDPVSMRMIVVLTIATRWKRDG
jgi:hypothetical protein